VSRVAYALLRSGLFTALSDAALDDLTRRISTDRVGAGELVMREGDAADASYVVLSGSLEVLTHTPDGQEILLARIGPGEHFGEQALLGGAAGRRTATVRGVAPSSELVRIGRDQLLAVLSNNERLRERLLELGNQYRENRLSRCTELVRALLAGGETRARELALDNGHVLYRQHDPPGAVYVILSGRVELLVERDGLPLRVALVGAGLCVGERDTEARAATAVVDGPARLLEIPREDLQRLTRSSAELRDHLAALDGIWELPQRGFVTQHLGAIDGQPCVTQIFHLADRRKFVSSHLIGDGGVHFEAVQGEPARDVATPDESARVLLSADGRIWSIEAKRSIPALGALVARAIEGKPLLPLEEAELARSGSLACADAGFACACMRVPRSVVRLAIQAGARDLATLQQRTGCGLSCGSCVPSLREMLGDSAFVPVKIARVDTITEQVRRFHLTPSAREPMPSSRPGQHVILRVTISGERVERPFTLSSAAGAPWEVTVKREPGGCLSSWLFECAEPGSELSASAPRGDYIWEGGAAPIVCFTCGIGVTPALSFARTMLREGWPHRLVIHWSAREERDAAILRELERAGAPNLTIVPRYTSRVGRLGEADVRPWAQRFPSALFFLCGTEGYMNDVRCWLLEAKVPAPRIRIESFVRAPGA
jgi:ferredoxin-NADP reductase/CRP-like cAMP-binding protein